MGFFFQTPGLVVLLVLFTYPDTSAILCHRQVNPHCFTRMVEVTAFSVLTCVALCDKTPGCFTVDWEDANSSCILVGSEGSNFLTSLDSLSVYKILVNFTAVNPGSPGVSNDSNPEQVFCNNPGLYYKSEYFPGIASSSNFGISFSSPVIITKIELVYVDLGINQTTPSFMHWHMNMYPYCDPALPDPQPKGLVVDYICPGQGSLTSIASHVSFQGYFAFNNLQFFGPNNVSFYP